MSTPYDIMRGMLSDIDNLKLEVKVLERIIADIQPLGHFIRIADDKLHIKVHRTDTRYEVSGSSMLPHFREALRQTKETLKLKEQELEDLTKNRAPAKKQRSFKWWRISKEGR